MIFTLFWSTTFLYAQDKPNTILWKVTKPGSKTESFLFGTFHEVSPSFFRSLSNVVNKLQQSDILFVERRMDATEVEALTEQPLWTSEKWNAILTDEQKKIFSEFVEKSEDTSYYNYHPLLLAVTTSRLYLTNFCDTGAATTELMDEDIEKIAIRQEKQVYSLDGNQMLFLKNVAENFSSLQDSLYTSGSIHYMMSMLNNDLSTCEIVNTYKKFGLDYNLDKDITRESDPLLFDRNNIWVQTLDEVLPTNNIFVAVGFRHLFYRQGLIQQLRELGYQVTPIPIVQ